MKLTALIGCLLAVSFSITGVCSNSSILKDGSKRNEEADSVRITFLMKGVDSLSSDKNKILFIAKGFQGTPYQAGTLETFPFERLVVRTDSVDCTTFVEYVLAMYLAGSVKDNVKDSCYWMKNKVVCSAFDERYGSFKFFLQKVRYRDGRLDGYTSRLHYFSDWILDNERKGIVREVTKELPYAVRKVDLDFMSQHSSLYPFLAKDLISLERMRKIERRWIGYQMPYIPKQKLNEGRDVLRINDGDILAIATNIKGLDVVHIGYACWLNGKLHLLHASSAKKQVILDPVPLFQYSKNKKSHIGIRVIRVL